MKLTCGDTITSAISKPVDRGILNRLALDSAPAGLERWAWGSDLGRRLRDLFHLQRRACECTRTQHGRTPTFPRVSHRLVAYRTDFSLTRYDCRCALCLGRRLHRRPRPSNENPHQPPSACRPVRHRRNVGNPHQRPKQIKRVEIRADFTAFNCAPHQGPNRSDDLRPGALKQSCRCFDQRIERRRNQLLGRDVVHKQEHPCPQCVHRRHRPREILLGGRESFHFGPIDRFQERPPRWKVPIQGSGSNTCSFGNLIEADVHAGAGESQFGNLEDTLAVVLRVGAGFSADLLGFFSHHLGSLHLPITRYLQAETISTYSEAQILSDRPHSCQSRAGDAHRHLYPGGQTGTQHAKAF
jgi:hypothetical protein